MSGARCVADLLAELQAGQTPSYVYFWGHRQRRPDAVDPSCLSRWFPAPFEHDGVRYATAEQFMMAARAELFGDADARDRIITADTPGAARAAGRAVRGFDQAEWERARWSIVVTANREKFRSNPPLAEYLTSTGEQVLVEASPVDPVWGIGMDLNEAMHTDPSHWRGENLLGFALMEVRDSLVAESAA